jgi:hypothetical protein
VPPQQPSSALCQVALLERLTRDVYCDKYELARLPRAAASVHVFGDFQVERPAPECKGSVVGMVLTGQAAVLDADGHMVVNTSAVLPIHARYPGPAQPGQATLQSVVIAPPVVLLRCGTAPGAAWQVASAMPQTETQPLIWKARACISEQQCFWMHGCTPTDAWFGDCRCQQAGRGAHRLWRRSRGQSPTQQPSPFSLRWPRTGGGSKDLG